MIIVGIDPSLTSTGIAVLDGGQPVDICSDGIDGHKADSTIIRNRNIRAVNAWIQRVLNRHAIDFAAVEGPSYGSRYGNPHERGGLYHAVVAYLDTRHVPIAVVPPKVRAMWATGNGNADKPEVTAQVRTWWPGLYVANDDQADALVIAAMVALKLGDPLPFVEKGRHRNALDSVEWPVRA